jgi:Cys-rich repeat protein
MTKVASNTFMQLKHRRSRYGARWIGAVTAVWALGSTLAACESECGSDSDCPGGEVCELGAGCQSPPRCVPGCRDDSQCGPGELCNQVQCITCPCPGICEPREESCETDTDCAFGEVCELSTGCQEPRQCTPGCRDDSQCPAGLECQQVVCITCPCPGLCE